jgi:glycosyltransferase involved in cell wall biosynthesis
MAAAGSAESMSRPPASLYICYLSLADPLVETQVVSYLGGLAAAGHRIHLLTFEPGPRDRTADRERRERLRSRGIAWHRAAYHKRPSLPATVFDTLAGIVAGTWIVLRNRLGLVHARNHVPAAMAMAICALTRRAMLFDVRGLMAEEYVDAGNWAAGSLPVRITKRVERAALARADAAVVLTEDARDLLFPGGEPDPYPVAVIPCCVDLSNFPGAPDPGGPGIVVPGRPRFAYVGKFSGWYMGAEMAALFARALARWPEAHFLILTQSEPALIEDELHEAGIGSAAYTITEVRHDRVGAVLEQADVGLSLIAPLPSKVASSPTKNAEYLAAGLPVVATRGVGGTDELIAAAPDAVIGIDRFDDAAYEEVLDRLAELLEDPAVGDRCRRLAAERLSLAERGIPAYEHLYELIAETASRSGSRDPAVAHD